MTSRTRLLIFFAFGFAGCGRQSDGLIKYPVQGTVLVNGRPEAGIVVRLVGIGSETTGLNGRFPVGVTDGEGTFHLSTNGIQDGAVAGEYSVTFQWPEQNEPPPGDRFGGQYSNADTSTFRAVVVSGTNQLKPFELRLGRRTRPARHREE